jgi:hypothetical protein
MDLSQFSTSQLRQLIRNYRLDFHVPAFTTQPREKLEKIINDFMEFIDNKIVAKKRNNVILITKGVMKNTEKQKTKATKSVIVPKQKKEKVKPEPKQEPLPDFKPTQPSKVKKEEKTEESIINSWNDDYLGYLMDGTKYGQNIESFIMKQNNKGKMIDDFGLLSFTKPLNNQIVERWGVDVLFQGIDALAEHYGAEKYNAQFGKMKTLPVKDYFNAKTFKEVQKRNFELFENGV